jgi:hypothetical protein
MLLVSCGGSADGPTVSVAESITPYGVQTGAEVVAAARPTGFTFEQKLVGPDPCSGEIHTLTITWTCREQQQANGAYVQICKREVVTDPTGYVGRGTLTVVDNGKIQNLRFTDVLKNDAGDRMQGRSHGLFDLSAGTVRIYKFDSVCLGQ